YAHPDFLRIYQFDVIQGNSDNMLTENNHVILTEKTAIALFGNTDVVGKDVEIRKEVDSKNYTVRGVLRDLPESSSVKFDYL
ncbi:ABC transporter permease, partial [Campylobacter fetus subsp. venerealis]